MDLFTASALGIREILKEYLKSNPAVLLLPNEKGWTPLMYACVYCQEETIALFISRVPSCIYSVNKRQQTALMLSAQCGNLNAVRMLCRSEILECKDENGWTALYYAVYNGHLDVIYYLIKCGANINVRDYKSQSLLTVAIEEKKEIIVTLLLAYGAIDLLPYSSESKLTAMDTARQSKSLSLVILLSVSSVTDLDSLLRNLRLDAYSTFFKENNIDLEKFLTLSEYDFKLLGISKIGPRKILALAAEKYKQFWNFKKQSETDIKF